MKILSVDSQSSSIFERKFVYVKLAQGIRCLENFAARGRSRWEDLHPQLAADIRALVEPHTYADPELKSSRRYTNWSAAEVLTALRTQKGHADDDLPSERTMRDILNRMGLSAQADSEGPAP